MFIIHTLISFKYLINLSVPLILAYAISIGSALLLPRLNQIRGFAHAQVTFDVILITGIIWITGDISSPFSFLYNLAVINAAILLFYQGAFIAAGSSSVCYGALILGSQLWFQSGNGAPLSWAALVTMVINIGSFFVIAALSGFLADKLGETQKLLKEKQSDFQELDAFKQALLQGIGSGVAITDRQGRINYYNEQAQTLTSLGEPAVMGKRLDQIFPGLKYDFQCENRNGGVFNEELPLPGSPGGQKQVRLTLTPLSDSNEQLLGYVAIFEDITKQKQFEEKVRLEEELRRSREIELQAPSKGDNGKTFKFEGVVGKSGGIEKIYQLIQKVAASSTNVLISGESGTGKELIAEAIHQNSLRAHKPFIKVNLGGISTSLFESEMFGHVRGAFTDARADRVGRFELANKGTIFLDEIGDLPLKLQAKLLRVLQEGEFERLGSGKTIKVDVRVIAATNRDLLQAMQRGRFRVDLYYRLAVYPVVLPPLREREADIELLAETFLREASGRLGRPFDPISGEVLRALRSYHWPGNIRELQNVIERAAVLSVGRSLQLPEEWAPVSADTIASFSAVVERGPSIDTE
jgi:PAS domain S-box-containing protein